ncbi:MAG TPA: hypothetical protein VLL08_00905 [Kineosporiaceae bacterium]|nr:hypothetical protein [Kineosporiaceae bacterium]
MALGTNATINDDVWDQLDPYAARLSAKDRHQVWAVVAATTLVACAVAALWWVGALTPQLRLGYGYRGSTPGSEPAFTIVLPVRSDATLPIHLRSAGRSGPGLQLIDAEVPHEVASGTRGEITLHYRVTDCSAVPTGSWPIPVHVDRFWGQGTAWVAGELEMSNEDAEDDSDLWEIPWQQAMAKAACSGRKWQTNAH